MQNQRGSQSQRQEGQHEQQREETGKLRENHHRHDGRSPRRQAAEESALP
jgi:hypothetical protein